MSKKSIYQRLVIGPIEYLLDEHSYGLEYLFYAVVIACFVIVFWKHPVDENRFYSLLKSEGVSDIQITSQGTFFSGCDGRENQNTSFKGNRNGVTVTGVVCGSSFFKAYTIRYF